MGEGVFGRGYPRHSLEYVVGRCCGGTSGYPKSPRTHKKRPAMGRAFWKTSGKRLLLLGLVFAVAGLAVDGFFVLGGSAGFLGDDGLRGGDELFHLLFVGRFFSARRRAVEHGLVEGERLGSFFVRGSSFDDFFTDFLLSFRGLVRVAHGLFHRIIVIGECVEAESDGGKECERCFHGLGSSVNRLKRHSALWCRAGCRRRAVALLRGGQRGVWISGGLHRAFRFG